MVCFSQGQNLVKRICVLSICVCVCVNLVSSVPVWRKHVHTYSTRWQCCVLHTAVAHGLLTEPEHRKCTPKPKQMEWYIFRTFEHSQNFLTTSLIQPITHIHAMLLSTTKLRVNLTFILWRMHWGLHGVIVNIQISVYSNHNFVLNCSP